MSWIKGFLDMIGNVVLWVEFLIQGVGVFVRFLLFSLCAKLIPSIGAMDHEWNLNPRQVSKWVFASLWIGSVFVLFYSTSVMMMLVVLVLETIWSLYALVTVGGERRREIFFHTLAIQVFQVLLMIGFVKGTGVQSWLKIDEFQHHGNIEAWMLISFLVLRAGLFPFHVNRLDYLTEMPVWLGICQTIFNIWIVFQAGLFMKCMGFTDAFGDRSSVVMLAVVISFLYAIALTAMQVRVNRMWAHLFWALSHIALYVTTL